MTTYYRNPANNETMTDTQPDGWVKVSAKGAKRLERADAIERLRAILKPGDKVTTTVLHVSRSGMSRSIMCQAVVKDDYSDGKPYVSDITYLVARAIGERMDDRGGVVVGGCGMDMCFHVVYSLGRVLFPEGFGIRGYKPSEHFAGKRRAPKTRKGAAAMVHNGWIFRGRNGNASGWDNDGGYALNYR